MQSDLQLTDHFSLKEFLVSQKHPKFFDTFKPTDVEIQNLFLLCRLVLEPIRDKFGVTLISSGLRPETLNMVTPGAKKNSQHRFGEAADIICPYAPYGLGEVYAWIIGDLKWLGETILYKRTGYVHVALPRYNVKADQFIEDS